MKDKHALIVMLEGLRDREDRAALAALRRGFQSPLAALPYVAPYFSQKSSRVWEDALLLVASLFALHPAPGGQSLGRALAAVREESPGVELRFRALLESSREDLPTHLRHILSFCAGKEIAIDHDDLLSAVLAWNFEGEPAQRRWARDFWGARPEHTHDENTTTDGETTP